MRVTNDHNLPAPFVRAVTVDGYSKGDADFSITELISPPRQSQLLKRHDDEIAVDASERLWMLMGTMAHEILERGGREGQELTEERLYAPVAGKRIGGKPDTFCLTSGRLTDYKITSVWSYVFGGRSEWTEQLNAYAFLARENHHPVKELSIFAMFRDWSQSRAKDEDYPKVNCVNIPVNAWSHEETRSWLKERIELHEQAKRTKDDALPDCTPEERWAKPTTYAVMKPGRKSAVAVGENRQAVANLVTPGTSLVERPGKSVRCESYCNAAPFCSQWKKDPTNVARPFAMAGVV